jgi:hypothetical protein
VPAEREQLAVEDGAVTQSRLRVQVAGRRVGEDPPVPGGGVQQGADLLDDQGDGGSSGTETSARRVGPTTVTRVNLRLPAAWAPVSTGSGITSSTGSSRSMVLTSFRSGIGG